MTDGFERLLEELERRRAQERTPECLPDATLEALACDSLSRRDKDAAVAHMSICMVCMQAYAGLRSLLVAAEPPHALDPTPGRLAAAAPWQRVAEFVRR